MERYYLTQRPPEPGAVPGGAAEAHTYGQNGTDFPIIGHVWGFVAYDQPLTPEQVADYELTPGGPAPAYDTIDEGAADRAVKAYSFRDYVHGSETEAYRRLVDKAAFLAYRQKQTAPEMYHYKLDLLLERYTKRLAENTNALNRNTASCPSVMIAGGSNFPVAKKEKQNAREDTLRRERQEIDAILDRMKSVGTGGISSDEPDALEKLQAKLDRLVKHQETMKAANAAIRLKDTAKGDARLTDMGYTQEEIAQLREPDYCGRVGYPDYALSNNNANIKRIRDRIDQMKKLQENTPEGWTFDGGTVEMNTEANRVQILFDGKPDEETRERLKRHGFRWSPRYSAWQRQLTRNAITDAKNITKGETA